MTTSPSCVLETDREPPSTINRIRPPVGKNKMIKTKKFEEIYDKVKGKKLQILECHGIPGSGKSQTIRKLGEKFPLTDNDVIIKWHIQCKDSGHDVKQELIKLAEKLLTHNHDNMTQTKYQSIVDGLDADNAELLANTLIEGGVPTLIIIEDPPLSSKELLSNFCNNLATNSTKATKEVHFYITSRTRFLSAKFVSSESCCDRETIQGFDKDEAVRYLNGGMSEEKKKMAHRIFKRFSGLPLGLQAAKGYCTNSRIDYEEYLELVELVDYDLVDKENKIIKEYGDNAEHVFQAIVLPFIPDDDSDTSALLQWKILSCISCLNYDRIPRFVLEYCCHLLREKPVKLRPQIRNKAEVGSLVTKLLDHGMCSETEEKEITFHEVILNSFRLNSRPFIEKSKFDPLKKALEIMCGLASKDMRKKQHSNQMHKLRRHLQSLLENIGKDEKFFDDEEDSILLRALASHLHETVAAIMLNESSLFRENSVRNFERALELLWEDSDQYTTPESSAEVDDVAKRIVDEAIEKSKDLRDDFAVKYASKLEYCLDDSELKFLKSKSKKVNGKNHFKAVETNLKNQESKEDLVTLLQKCGLFLSNEKFKEVFYAERFASILHSWSRVVLYAEPEAVQKDETCIWMSSLCRSICVECRDSCNVPQLIERLCMSGGWFPILLKQKKDSDVLKKALNTCKTSLVKQDDRSNQPMYENGLLKEVYGPSYDSFRIAVLRNIVRIGARLAKEGHSVDQDETDDRCQELFELAQRKATVITNGIMCIIYCAKYYAARGKRDHALDCFEKYFELEPKCKPRFTVKCWALYNYARAVLKFSMSGNYKEIAIQVCKVLNAQDVIPKSLKDHLEDCLKKLQYASADADD